MANLSIGGIEIAGIVACVPPDVEENISLSFFEDGEAEKVIVLKEDILLIKVLLLEICVLKLLRN